MSEDDIEICIGELDNLQKESPVEQKVIRFFSVYQTSSDFIIVLRSLKSI